jgi:hypothetical protein
MMVVWLAFPAAAADIGGKWAGKVEFKTPGGGTDGADAFAEFKQSGTDVTGRAGVGSEEDQVPIEKGKLEGNKLTFQGSLPGDSGPRVFKLNLVVVNANRIEGSFEGVTNGGDKVTGTISLDRKRS